MGPRYAKEPPRRALRASIQRRVYGMLRSRLNSVGMNVTEGRVADVMAILDEEYGYENVTESDILRETRLYVGQLERRYTR